MAEPMLTAFSPMPQEINWAWTIMMGSNSLGIQRRYLYDIMDVDILLKC
jgi:hypothetical protein